MHPSVVGLIARGQLADRAALIELLNNWSLAAGDDHDEVLGFIERQRLCGRGIGFLDLHLLVAAALTPGARLSTRVKRLGAAAPQPGLAHPDCGRY